MTKPILLDLFCRMGGATVGYQRAGFHVIGVDIEPQPGYPGDDFIQGDATSMSTIALAVGKAGGWPTLIHTSPPCQGQNTATASNRIRGIKDEHPDLVKPIRDLLQRTNLPYVIEQPTSSVKGTIRRDVTLCMDMFKGDLRPPWVQKHRSFEISGWIPPAAPHHRRHEGYVRGYRHGVNRTGSDAPYVAGYGAGGGKATAEELRHAMGIDWMTERFDLCEAIPPAYTEWLGRAFLLLR